LEYVAMVDVRETNRSKLFWWYSGWAPDMGTLS